MSFAESTVEEAALSWRDALLPACSADRLKLLSGEVRVKAAEKMVEETV